MRLHDVIEEINQLRSPSTHKAALDIYNLLENNRALFAGKVDEADFKALLSGFEALAYAHPSEYGTDAYVSGFERLQGLLRYHLNKIL